MIGRAHQSGQGQIQRFQRIDPFAQMNQMMMSFGGLNHDPFFGSMMGFGRDPFEDMFKFSDIHKNMHSRGNQGSFVCQSFVSSSKMGPNGQMVTQNYYENSMGQNKGGKTISQKQQAYKNNQGINRIAEERMLDNKGRKIVREKIGENVQETNHYYNIDQQEAQEFDTQWQRTDGQMNFVQNHQRYIQNQQIPTQMRIEYQPQPRRTERLQARQPRNNYLEHSNRNQPQPQRQSYIQYQPSKTHSTQSRLSRNSEHLGMKSRQY